MTLLLSRASLPAILSANSDYFHISVHSFIRDRKHYETVSWAEEVYVTLPSQIYSSFFRDMANLVRIIMVFPNAIKNLVVCLLWKIFLIHLKYKS